MDKRALIATALGYKFGEDFEITLHPEYAGLTKIEIVDTKTDLSAIFVASRSDAESIRNESDAEHFAQNIFLRAQLHFPHLCGRDEELVARIKARIAKVANEYSYSTVYNLVGRSPDVSVKFMFTNYDSGHVFVVDFPRSEFTRDNFKSIIANVTERLKEIARREASAKEALLDKKEEEKQEAEERKERRLNAKADKVCKIIISHVERYMTGNGCEILSKYELKANTVKFYFWGSKDGVSFLESIQIRADVIIECCGDKNKTADTAIKINRTLEKAINARNYKPSHAPAQKASTNVVGFGAWGA